MDVGQVPEHSHLGRCKDFGFTLTELWSHWKVLDVKDCCCDLTNVFKGPLWLLFI